MLFVRCSSLGTNSFLVIILYFLIIDSILVNAITVLLEFTRLTILIKTWGLKLCNKKN